MLIISSAHISIPILIKPTLTSFSPHYPRKSGHTKDTNDLQAPRAHGSSQSSLYLIYQQQLTLLITPSPWKHVLHFVFRKPSPLLVIFFLPAVLAAPSLSSLLISP